MIDPAFLKKIESLEKAVAWGVVGSRRRLGDAVMADLDMREVLNALRDQPEARLQLANRISILPTMGGCPEYLQRYDLAIFAYLRALDIFDPELAAVAARKVATPGNIWWSRNLALRLRSSSRTSSRDTGSKVTQVDGDVWSMSSSFDTENCPTIVTVEQAPSGGAPRFSCEMATR